MVNNTHGQSRPSRLTVYNFVRRFAGPALAYRLSYAVSTPSFGKQSAKSHGFAGRVAA